MEAKVQHGDAARAQPTRAPQSPSLCVSLRPATAGSRGSAETFGRFFEFVFSAAEPLQDASAVAVPLQPLGASAMREVWSGPTATYRSRGTMLQREIVADGAAMLSVEMPMGASNDLGELTHRGYTALLRRAQALGLAEIHRIWNIVPQINAGSGDHVAYVRFGHARALAFDAAGLCEQQYPAASAVGSPVGSPLVIAALFGRDAPIVIENPRQVSAYRYPRRYGPRAPAFARATLLRGATGGTLLISGTASIVGHASQHLDIAGQLAETFRNLIALFETARRAGWAPSSRRSNAWRIYLRDPADLEYVRRECELFFGPQDSLLFLQADICRSELLVEIEGACGPATRSVGGNAG